MKLRKILAIMLLAAVVTTSTISTAASAAVDNGHIFPYIGTDETVDFNNHAFVALPVDLAGKTVIIREGLTQNADIHLHGGNLIVVGDYNLSNGTIYTEGGTVTVSGNMNIGGGMVVTGFAENDETAADDGGSFVVSQAVYQNGGTVSAGNGLFSAHDYELNSGTINAAEGKINVTINFTQLSGTVNGNSGTIEIGEEYNQTNGRLNIGAGNVTVNRDYFLAVKTIDENSTLVFNNCPGTLCMDDENGHFTVGGTFVTCSYYGSGSSYNNLAKGTLELKGDFMQLVGNQSNFRAEKDHKVIFTGNRKQTIRFENPSSSRFGTIAKGSNEDVDIVCGSALSTAGVVTVRSFVQYGSMDLCGNSLVVRDDFEQNGDINVNSGNITVEGNWFHKTGALDLNNGSVTVKKNYTLGKVTVDENGGDVIEQSSGILRMNDENDYMLVYGDFVTKSWYGNGTSYNYLTNGVLELKGNFSQLGGDQNNFRAEQGHKVVFSGNTLQKVFFENCTSSRFGTIEATDNTQVDIIQGNAVSLNSGVTLRNFNQYGNLDLNGQTVTVTKNFTQNGNVNINGGKITVEGTWQQKDGSLDLNNGSVIIKGDYILADTEEDELGNGSYVNSSGTLKMNDDKDYMLVYGDFVTKSWYGNGTSYNYLTNGTLELKGDFTQLNGDQNNFRAEKGHKVVFSGDTLQKVFFENCTSSRFGTIEATNNTEVDFIQGNVCTIAGNITVRNFNQYGDLDIAGNKLTLTGEMIQNGNIDVNGGSVNVVGEWWQPGGSLDLNNGNVNIEGAYINAGFTEDENGTRSLISSSGTLKMNNENDYMRVGGDFTTMGWYGNGTSYNNLTNGTLELCGNFNQLGGDQNNFRAEKDHKVLFNGTGRQTITFGNPTSSRFGTLVAGENAVVDIVSGNIAYIGSDVVLENFNQYGDLDVNGKKLTITGNVTQNGNVNVNAGSIKVEGNWLQQKGAFDLNNGHVEIDGNYTIGEYKTDDEGKQYLATAQGTLKMNDEKDYLLVGGDFTTNSWYGNGTSYNNLTNGVLELKGNFTQLGGDQNNFRAEEGHVVLFSGEEKQKVNFNNPGNSRFGTICAGKNTEVDIESGNIMRLGSDVTIGSFNQYGNFDVNGYTLSLTGNMTENGNISVNNGKISVSGNWLHKEGTLDLNNGRVEIAGNYTLGNIKTDSEGKEYTDNATGILKMDNENDYLLVGGDFTTKSWYGNGTSYNNLTNGTLELKGNFSQLNGDQNNFRAEENHKVIFSGNKKQVVSFYNTDSSGFGTLLRTDNSNVDVTGSFKKLGDNVTLANFEQHRNLDLNGFRLTLTGNMTQMGNVNGNRGTADVAGNWLQKNGTLDINEGMIRIGGNYTIANPKTDDEGVEYLDNSTGILKMNDARDYMLVEGNFTTKSWYGNSSSYNNITNGVLEIKGNFSQIKGDNNNFRAEISHVTVLSGDGSQTVCFQGSGSHFGQLAVSTIKTDENFYDLPYEDFSYYLHRMEFDHPIGISTISSTSIKRGESVDLLARVTMAGTTCVYAVYVSIDGEPEQEIGTYIGPNFGLSYTPPKAGEYKFRVYAITSELKTVEQELFLTVNPADAITTGASLSNAEITEGESVTVDSNVMGGVAPYTYSYAYRAAGTESWTAIEGDSASAQFTPAAAGNYEIKVTVTDLDGTKAETVLALTVNPDTSKVINNSTINSTALSVGSRLILTGAAEGGDGNYTYTYSYKRTTSRVWNVIGNEDTTDTVAFMTPSSAGDFDIRIIARDGAGKSDEKTFTLKVSSGKSESFKNLSTISTTGAKPGTRVILTGKAEGSSGYRYAYYYKRTNARAWTILGEEFGTSAIGAFTPRSPGEFNVKVDIIDEKGEIVSRMFALSISDDYVDTTMINTSKVSTASTLPGTRVVLTGSAEGGAGDYTYAFYYKRQNASNWTVLGTEFSSSSVQAFTPRTLGDYIVKIAVKDADGGMTSKNFDLEITNDPKPEEKELENISTISATSVTAGTTVKVTGAAENGTSPYTFTYFYKKSTAAKWTEMTSADGAYAAIRLRNTGDYNFKTIAKDSEGKEAEKVFNVKVN